MSRVRIDRGVRPAAAGCLCILFLFASAPTQAADGTVNGDCRIEKVLGQSGDYLDLYEWGVHIARVGGGVNGKSYRVGLPPNPTSYYTFTMPAGTHTLMLDQSLFWGRPKVQPNVVIPSGGTTYQEVRLPMDYGCAFGGNFGIWGSNPWTAYGTPWYQTFVASGTSVTGVQFKLAGANAKDVRVTFHRDNGGSIVTWPQVGIARTRTNVGTNGDQWLRYRSGEVPLTPGDRYAVKLTGLNGASDNNMAVYRRIEDGKGYRPGCAYNAAGAAQNFDLYATVLTDTDHTVVSYCTVEYDGGELAGSAATWAQGIKAKGNSLAGCSLFFAGGDTWDALISFKVRSGSPTGPQVGPTKVGRGTYQASTAGMIAASWNPGEVPLTPGQVYYIEMTRADGNGQFNPFKFTVGNNHYGDGNAYKAGVLQNDVHLFMQVVEWNGDGQLPRIETNRQTLVHTIIQGQALASDSFTIRNSGAGTLNYILNDDAGWLSASPSSGSSTGETDTISLDYTTTSLVPGSYEAIVAIVANGATNTPVVVEVRLTVTPQPTIALSPWTISAVGIHQKNAASAAFTVRNTGGGTLAYTITDDRDWMSCVPTAGTCVGEVDPITIQFASAGLAPGIYTGTISVTDPYATVSTETIGVTLNVLSAPDLDQDQDVDLSDFTLFQLCFAGPNRPASGNCTTNADFDDDNDVDLADFGRLQACFNGPNRPPACQ